MSGRRQLSVREFSSETFVSIEVVAKALRCTSTPGNGGCDIPNCPYRKQEDLSWMTPEELAKIGNPEDWICCDIDRIGIDAAEILEGLCS